MHSLLLFPLIHGGLGGLKPGYTNDQTLQQNMTADTDLLRFSSDIHNIDPMLTEKLISTQDDAEHQQSQHASSQCEGVR